MWCSRWDRCGFGRSRRCGEVVGLVSVEIVAVEAVVVVAVVVVAVVVIIEGNVGAVTRAIGGDRIWTANVFLNVDIRDMLC